MKCKKSIFIASAVVIWLFGSSPSFASINSLVPPLFPPTNEENPELTAYDSLKTLDRNVQLFEDLLIDLGTTAPQDYVQLLQQIDVVFADTYNVILALEQGGNLSHTQTARVTLQTAIETYMARAEVQSIPAAGKIEVFSVLLTESLIANS